MKTTISNSFKALLGVALLAVSVNALPKISVGGRYLYDESGNRFYIKGVGYQPQGGGSAGAFGEPTDFIDPLSSGTNCTRDIPHLKDLGVNTVRVYSVNSTLNHDDCMKGLSAAGIYTIIDLSLPQSSITRDTPAWSTDLQNTYLSTVKAFSAYDNVLAYNVGNEVVIATNGTAAATFIKAAARDTKAFIKSLGSSALVGYAAIDGASDLIDPLASYLACDPSGQNSGADAIDLYGTNNYRWAGDSTFQQAWAATHADFAGLNIPAYLSEYGKVPAGGVRPWQEVGSLFSTDMSDIFSGGVAFNYFPAQSADGQFGMVTISADGSSVQTSQDFSNLQTAYGKATGPTSPSKSDAGSTSYPSCAQSNSTFSASTSLPPTPNVDACNCLEKASPCQFKAKTNNETQTAIDIGTLLNYGCTQLGQLGLNCDDIGADGITGKYGKASTCSPDIKLSYVFSLYYQNQKQDAQACNFAGAATVNAAGSRSFPTGAAESCGASATGTTVPVLPSSSGSGSSTKSGTGSGATPTNDSNGNSGALGLSPSGGVLGLSLMTVLGLLGGAVVLA